MKVSDMKNRIEIIPTKPAYDEDGFPIEDSPDSKIVWASVSNLYGKEYWSAKAVQAENTLVFTIRYSRDLADLDTKNYKIKFKGKDFDIKHIDNVKYLNKELKIKAIEVI